MSRFTEYLEVKKPKNEFMKKVADLLKPIIDKETYKELSNISEIEDMEYSLLEIFIASSKSKIGNLHFKDNKIDRFELTGSVIYTNKTKLEETKQVFSILESLSKLIPFTK